MKKKMHIIHNFYKNWDAKRPSNTLSRKVIQIRHVCDSDEMAIFKVSVITLLMAYE